MAMEASAEGGTSMFPEGELALGVSSQNENAPWDNAGGGGCCKRQTPLLGQVSAAEEDVSLQCGLHAYRFSLRDFDFGGYLVSAACLARGGSFRRLRKATAKAGLLFSGRRRSRQRVRGARAQERLRVRLEVHHEGTPHSVRETSLRAIA